MISRRARYSQSIRLISGKYKYTRVFIVALRLREPL